MFDTLLCALNVSIVSNSWLHKSQVYVFESKANDPPKDGILITKGTYARMSNVKDLTKVVAPSSKESRKGDPERNDLTELDKTISKDKSNPERIGYNLCNYSFVLKCSFERMYFDKCYIVNN